MKKLFALAGAALLAACTPSDDASDDAAAAGDDGAAANSVLEGDAPGFEAVAPGTYQVTRSGGEVDYIEIHPGMTFSRVDADGNATGGSIFMKGGRTCFLVEGAEEENCFTDGPRNADGSMETTSEAGAVSTVRPVEGSLADNIPAE